MMVFAQSVLIEALALAVAAATVCRLTKLHAAEHKLIWIVFYFFGLFCGSAAAIYETVVDGPTWATLLLLCGAAVYLWASRVSWRDSAPRYLQK